MDQLFAPWRMTFIEKYDGSKGCVLCDLPKDLDDKKMLIVHRGTNGYVVLNKFPYSNGHLMVLPHQHLGGWSQLSDSMALELHHLVQASIQALSASLKPQGFNIGMNVGRAAGQGVEGHLHWHIVPRWVGDINFMPLLADVKVISEHLETTYDRIRAAWPSDQGQKT